MHKLWRGIALLALPGMAVMAAAQQMTPAAVEYTHHGASTTDAVRLIDDCFAAPVVVRKWGWAVELKPGNTAEITVDGDRMVRVPLIRYKGREMVRLNEAAQLLGAKHGWSEDGKTYRIQGWIRNVEVTMTGIRVDSTLPVKARAFKLSQPDRLVLDFEGGTFEEDQLGRLPAGWRVGQFAPNIFRVVVEHSEMARQPIPALGVARSFQIPLRSIDANAAGSVTPGTTGNQGTKPDPGFTGQPVPPAVLAAPTTTESADAQEGITFLFPIKGGKPGAPNATFISPYELKLVIPNANPEKNAQVTTTDSRWARSYSIKALGNNKTELRIRFSRPFSFEANTTAAGLSIRLFAPPNADGTLGGKVIVLDAGHGGHDPGAMFGPYREKDYALKFTKRTAEELIRQGASVILTRGDDRFIQLYDRSKTANNAEASVFLSIHVNSTARRNSTTGSMTFYHKQSPTGMLLAKCIQDEIGKISTIPNKGTITDQRIYNSGFAVLRTSKMPAVLIEAGFINHDRDRAALSHPDYPKWLAEAIARGLKVYFGAKKNG